MHSIVRQVSDMRDIGWELQVQPIVNQYLGLFPYSVCGFAALGTQKHGLVGLVPELAVRGHCLHIVRHLRGGNRRARRFAFVR